MNPSSSSGQRHAGSRLVWWGLAARLGLVSVVIVLLATHGDRLERPAPRTPASTQVVLPATTPASAPATAQLTPLGKSRKGYREFRNEKDGSVLIEVPAGTSWLGSSPEEVAAGNAHPSETPRRQVRLERFLIGKYEVTNAQYERFLADTDDPAGPLLHAGHEPDEGPGKDHRPHYPIGDPRYAKQSPSSDCPVNYIDWYDARAYCAWAGLKLPAEAQWERAARGDGPTPPLYPWGNEPPNAGGVYRANYATGQTFDADGYRFAAPVGSFPAGASPFGVHDLAGNVWEWCQDVYDRSYYLAGGPPEGSFGPAGCREYVAARGGGWGCNPFYLRPAFSHYDGFPLSRSDDVGFRVAK